MAQFAVERYGRLDILHSNVGVGTPGTPETVGLGEWNHVLEANLTSAICAADRASQGCSHRAVFAAGAAGLSGSPGAVAYASAKAGMHGLTRSVAADYAAEGIRVSCLIVGACTMPRSAMTDRIARIGTPLRLPS